MRILAMSGSIRNESSNSILLKAIRNLLPANIEWTNFKVNELPFFDPQIQFGLEVPRPVQSFRHLAHESGNAAKEISDMLMVSSNKVAGIVNETQSKVFVLIKSGKGKVEAGNSIAKQCSIVLNEIVTKVHAVTEMAEEISASSIEQKEGFKLITKNVLEMDKVTQENTTLSRQTSETLESLNLQSAELSKASSELSQMVGVKRAS